MKKANISKEKGKPKEAFLFWWEEEKECSGNNPLFKNVEKWDLPS